MCLVLGGFNSPGRDSIPEPPNLQHQLEMTHETVIIIIIIIIVKKYVGTSKNGGSVYSWDMKTCRLRYTGAEKMAAF